MVSRRTTRQNRRAGRFDSNELHGGVLRLQYFADACECSTSPDRRNENAHHTVGVPQISRAVYRGVRGIAEVIEHHSARIFCQQCRNAAATPHVLLTSFRAWSESTCSPLPQPQRPGRYPYFHPWLQSALRQASGTPRRSASAIIATPTRSLRLPRGWRISSFAVIRADRPLPMRSLTERAACAQRPG